MSTTAALALVASNQRRIILAFRTAKAVTGATARRLRDLGLNDSGPLRLMVEGAIIRKAGDRYYLDEQVWAGHRQLRGRTVLRIALVVAAVAAVAWLILR